MQIGQGPMLRFFKYFRRKVWRKYWRFLLKLLLVFAKIVIITLVFEKNANFFAENWQKSQQIVIITPTPGGIGTQTRVVFYPG
jgi:hypothetical protein